MYKLRCCVITESIAVDWEDWLQGCWKTSKLPLVEKKKVCESGLTSHSHNAYRPITPLQPEGSQTHSQAPNIEKLLEKNRKKY